MQPTRRARLESVIKEELSRVVPREVKDPRVPSVTFTQVEVTQDGSQATVLVSILGGAYGGYGEGASLSEAEAKKRMKDCLAGLASASGFLRRHLASVLNVRHVPSLLFKEDRGLENTARVFDLLKQLEQTAQGAPSPAVTAQDDSEDDSDDTDEESDSDEKSSSRPPSRKKAPSAKKPSSSGGKKPASKSSSRR